MQAAAAVIPGTDGPSISLQRERGLRMGKGKRKHWSAVLLKKVWWYLPKTLFYHLVFRPFYLPELRSKCQFVTLTDTGKVSMIELPMSELPAKPEGRVRLVAVSDTHDYFQHIGVPPGDVLIHSGDIVFKGGRGRRDYEAFNRHLGTLPHPVKLVIVGNHDWYVLLCCLVCAYPILFHLWGELPLRPLASFPSLMYHLGRTSWPCRSALSYRC
jgi:hypothetical protein